MSCPTAQRWFVPDKDYYHLTEDYALVDKSANVIQSLVRRYIMPKDYQRPQYDSFYEYMRYGPRWFLQNTWGNVILIYADVDRAKPGHRAMVHDLAFQKPWLEEEELGTKEAYKGLIKYARDVLFHQSDDVDKWSDDELKAETVSYVREMFADKVVDYILSLRDTTAKTETLRILSGQMRCRRPRPVMILIKMLGNMDAGGWAVAYDFVKDLITLKSFDSEGGQHPLDESWTEKPPRDDIYHSASPRDYAKTLVSEFASEATGARQRGFRLAVSYLAGKWIRNHQKELGLPEELSVNLQKALAAMKAELKKEVFPNPAMLEPPKRNVVQMEWMAQRDSLLQDEDDYRDLAIQAKEEGFEASANNLAQYFERTVKELGQFAKDPEAPLEL